MPTEGSEEEEMPRLQKRRFAIDETPYCVWDWDIRQVNLDYLDSIDPRYFAHMATIHGPSLEGEERQYAAAALRMAYTHGLESLFALICAAIQAPDCVVGWLLKYKNIELESVVKKISGWESVYSKLKLNPITWEKLAETFLPFTAGDAERDSRVKQAFGRLWGQFAHDFIDENNRLEYNSIKHGIRARMGGFYLAMGLEDQPGVPAPPERMETVAQSDFGSSFFVAEKLQDGRNLRIRRQSLNWNPENFLPALDLISTSITNVIAFLKLINGVPPAEVEWLCPDDEAYFEEPWARSRGGVYSLGMNSTIEASFITPLSKEEILSVYVRENEEHQSSNTESGKS
jgi:hypothetical protein